MNVIQGIFASLFVVVGLYGAGVLYSFFIPRTDNVRVWVPSQGDTGPAIVEATAAEVVSSPDRRRVKKPETSSIQKPQFETASRSVTASPAMEEVDDFETASLASAVDPDRSGNTVPRSAHVQWCSSRYRSYRVDSNSYTPYSGGSRKCVSPYTAGSSITVQMARQRRPEVANRSVARRSGQHVQSCFDRYRSYRVSDNSYQPYGGGPRRQCQ
jgi:hypothetical protein